MALFQWRRLGQAMQRAADMVQRQWHTMAQRLLTRPGERLAYEQGLQASTAPVQTTASGLTTRVHNTAPAASGLEDGHGPFHLPSHINWATTPGARRYRDGRYYLIIPFRHYSAQRGSRAAAASATARRSMLSRAVYDVAKQIRPGEYLTAGPSQGRAVHAPGLHPYQPRLPQNVRPASIHAAAQERLRRTGQGSGTRYLTFRTMTQDSPGWWIPARPPRAIAAATVQSAAPDVRRQLADAAFADINAQIEATIRQGGR